MSDHPKEAQRELRRIVICADVCLAVFRLLPPAKVGLELALVSCRFDALVDAHFRSRRWALGKLAIVKTTTNGEAQIVKRNTDGSSETLPIPQTPLPNGVVGFACVICCYFTEDFLRRIGRLLQSDITLEFGFSGYLNVMLDNIFRNFISSLLNASVGIVKMRFQYQEFFIKMRSISPSVLRDFANLRVVDFRLGCRLEFPPEDSAEASVGQALCKWLHTPLGDGRPKVLEAISIFSTAMEELKTEFLGATTGVSFIIISSIAHGAPFQMENLLTNEQLTMRRSIGSGRWIVVRSSIGKNEDQWAEWEREALEEGTKLMGIG